MAKKNVIEQMIGLLRTPIAQRKGVIFTPEECLVWAEELENMTKYLDKDALVAEIKNRRDSFYSLSKSCEKGTPAKAGFYAQAQTLEGILSFLDTLEANTIETKEVDLNRESAWKPADGDELPEIDREVIALIPAYDGWKVVFAHRPDPAGFWGKSILSDEYEHFLPETYDGWNIPNIKWWLDLDLPNMED